MTITAASAIVAPQIGGIETPGGSATAGTRGRHMEAHRRTEHGPDDARHRRDGYVPALPGGHRRGLSLRGPWRGAGAWLIAALGAAVVVALLLPRRAVAEPEWHNPVKVVADARLVVTSQVGTGEVPLYVSADWSHPLANIRRAVIVVHGVGRDADGYLRGAEAARVAAGPAGEDTLLIVPQFLADIDAATFHLSPVTLHWSTGGWSEGEPAHGPAPLSGFDVFDTILRRLADRALLPNLAHVVLAGHSAGGQMVQRYSVVGRGEAALAAHGLVLRYVVANPSSYLYFSNDRPVPVDRAACPHFDRWKYGLAGAPPYVGDTMGMEARFAARQVVYLRGTADTDPHQPDLDTSCGGEAEGAYRLARGEAYFAYLQARHPGTLAQRVALVAGVGHSGGKMFGSVCGMAALFDRPGCPGL